MPEIGGGDIGKTYAVGFWQSQNCDNSLALFPSGIDFSWGILGLEADGLDDDNYVEVKLLVDDEVKKVIKYNINGKKKFDVSQVGSISSTDDVKIRIEVTTWV